MEFLIVSVCLFIYRLFRMQLKSIAQIYIIAFGGRCIWTRSRNFVSFFFFLHNWNTEFPVVQKINKYNYGFLKIISNDFNQNFRQILTARDPKKTSWPPVPVSLVTRTGRPHLFLLWTEVVIEIYHWFYK